MNALLVVLTLGAAQSVLTTTAEQTKYVRTGRYAEVEALCAAYPKAFVGKVKCEKFGVTPMGRPMLLVVASADGTFSAEEAAKKRRPVVLVQGGIHAGEVDGKDAGFEVLRALLEGSLLPGALSKFTLVFVPVFNVDGHERFGPNNRANQVGPQEMGFRVTAQNFNLNRDYTKADAPEMQAMLKLMHAYDPVLQVDLHVTDGAKFQHDLAVCIEPSQYGPPELRVLGKALRVATMASLTEKGHLPIDFYPAFVTDDQPASGFAYTFSPPRFGTGYWSQNNRLAVLVETHSWKSYAQRVGSTIDALTALLSAAKDDAARWQKVEREADAADSARAGGDVTVTYQNTSQSKPIEFQGYAYKVETSEVSGKDWVRYDDSKPEVWRVPYFDELVPALVLPSPKGGYLVPPEHAAWLGEKLKLHAFRFKVLQAAKANVAVEVVRVEPKFKASPTEGRQTVQSKGAWKTESRSIPAGTLFVPTAQPRLQLLMGLLEPASNDSYFSWGFFNAHLEQKEYVEDYVLELWAREQLQNPTVKAAFDEALKVPAFAKDPEARLEFFRSKHPTADERLNLYPVFRTADPHFIL